MLRYSCVGVALVVAMANVCYSAWTIGAPIGGAHNPSMSVTCSGTGADAACNLKFRIYVGGNLKNHGIGTYAGSPLFSWNGSVAPPSGGFGSGQATIKVWRESQDWDTDDPLVEGTFSFNEIMTSNLRLFLRRFP
jgi:hypothetical protein